MSGGFTQLWEVSVRWAEAFPLTVTPWQALPGWQRSGEGWLPWSLASLLVALFFAPPLFCSACRELTPKALFHGFPCQLASSWLCRWETLEGNSWVSEILKGRDYCPLPPRNVSFLHQDLLSMKVPHSYTHAQVCFPAFHLGGNLWWWAFASIFSLSNLVSGWVLERINNFMMLPSFFFRNSPWGHFKFEF